MILKFQKALNGSSFLVTDKNNVYGEFPLTKEEDEISAECEKICAEHDCKKCWEFFLNGHHGE